MRLIHPGRLAARFLTLLCLLLGALPALAQDDLDGLLPVTEAYKLTADASTLGVVKLHWTIAPDYYLYRGRMKFKAADGATLGEAQLPDGEKHHDEYLGDVETYHHGVDATVPYTVAAGTTELKLSVQYQGCHEVAPKICYPPHTEQLSLPVPAGAGAGGGDAMAAALGKLGAAKGGTLRGHGTIVGNVTNNGSVQPGGSIGTLTIQGNYTQGANGALVIDAAPTGQADLLTVNGKASIAGSTVVLGATGNWAPRTDYTILTATQGVSGQFASASSNLAFLTPMLAYGANSVTLSLERNDVTFTSVAQTPNERATAGAVEALGWNSALYNAVVMADAATARHAYDQLSGEIYASTRTALMDDSRYVRDAINDHLLGLSNTATGTSATDDNGVSAWTSGWGHWGGHDANGNASRLQANGSGLLVGADMALGSQARIGAVAGFGENSAKVDTLGSSSHTTGTHLGIYGGMHADAFDIQRGVAAGADHLHGRHAEAEQCR